MPERIRRESIQPQDKSTFLASQIAIIGLLGVMFTETILDFPGYMKIGKVRKRPMSQGKKPRLIEKNSLRTSYLVEEGVTALFKTDVDEVLVLDFRRNAGYPCALVHWGGKGKLKRGNYSMKGGKSELIENNCNELDNGVIATHYPNPKKKFKAFQPLV